MNLKNFIIKKSLNKLLLVISIIFLISISFEFYSSNDFSVGFSRIQNLLKRMFPIDFSILNELKQPILETINIALFSTILALFTALLVLPLTTNVLFKLKVIPRIISAIFSIFRTIPFLIIAAILVSLFSTGVFSGFICMYIINLLTASKLLKEYAEEVDIKHLEAIECLGVSKFAIYKTAIISNLKPVIISVYFLMLESSIRGASVLGMVGAGGIGEELWKNLSFLRYDKVSFIIVILLGFIFLTDTLSWFFRKKDNLIKITTSKGYKRSKFISNFVIIGVLILLVFSLNILYEDTNKISAPVFFERLFTFLKKFRNLDFTYSGKALLALWQSFLVAFFATVFAAPSAIIVSYFANSVTSNKIIAFLIKIFINFIRTFPPVIVAILFFSGFGPGLISGFFALYLYTTGVITKVYVDVLESVEVDYGLYGKSLGLRNFYIYLKLWLPSTYTNFVSIFLYRFESNMKNSSVLGMVGAGGIGQLLMNHIAFRNWEKVWVLLIFLIITIILIENLSEYIRNKVNK